MRVFNTLDELKDIRETAVALGNFDGVHMGHRALIRRAVDKAKEKGIKSAVFTFSNHPRNLIAGRNIVQNIITGEQKEKIIEEHDVDYLFNIEFTWDICNMKPELFVEELLCRCFRMKYAICGFNYRFGSRAEGTPELLKEMGRELDFELDMFEPVIVDGNIVSSTFIRGLIETGQVERCRKYMGERYRITGSVVVGNKIGRTIGFPTVNQIIDENMITPSNGVYITTCTFEGKTYPSITNIGVKPTIGDYKKNAETHIFDFSGDLYGKEITVEFIKKTRDEKKFNGIEELTAQIDRDCMKARKYHGLD